MITLKKTINKYPDLFLQERSATKRLSILLTPEYHKLTLSDLIKKAIEIINLEDTIISDKKKEEYIENFNKQKSTISFQYYITSILMKGSNLTLT
jgi:hypothetical protein